MKVSELFAEIGFKVDTSGLNEFSKAMKGIQETIKGCVTGLKEFSKAAEQINKAVQNIRSAYVPTQKEAAQRYRAETYYFRSAGKELRGRAIMEKGKGNFFQINADLREQQEERLTRQAQTNRERLELQKANNQLNREKFEYRKEHPSKNDISGAVTIGTIIGNIVSKAIHSLLSSLKGIFSSLFSFVKDTVRAAMAYRDYQSFTGRSVNELSDIMGLTAYTTSMTPKDILKDAQGIQKSYWDMWFGRGSPEAWLQLGLLPTGNGAKDLRNILKAIYNMTDKGQNTGMAMSMLSSFGLDEQYMNIFKAMREGREAEFQVMENEISAMDKANTKLNEFAQVVEQAKIVLVETLLKSGLKEMLDYFVSFLRTVISLLRGGAFKDKSFGESMDMVGQVLNATPQQREAWAKRGSGPTTKPGFFQLSKEVGKGAYYGLGSLFAPLWSFLMATDKENFGLQHGVSLNQLNPVEYWKDAMGREEYRDNETRYIIPQINNNFDFSGRSTDELGTGVEKVTEGEIKGSARGLYLRQPDANSANVMAASML